MGCRLHWLLSTPGGWVALITWLSCRTGFSSFPFYPVYPSRKRSALHSRAGYLSWATGSRSAVCRSRICSILPRDWFGFSRCTRRIYRALSYGNPLFYTEPTVHIWSSILYIYLHIYIFLDIYLNFFFRSATGLLLNTECVVKEAN